MDFGSILRTIRRGQYDQPEMWDNPTQADLGTYAQGGTADPIMPRSAPNDSPQLPERFTMPPPISVPPSSVNADEISSRLGAAQSQRMAEDPPTFARDLFQGLEQERPKPKWYDTLAAMASGGAAGYLNATNKFRHQFEGAPSSPIHAARMNEWLQKRRAAGEAMQIEDKDRARAMEQAQMQAEARHRADVAANQREQTRQAQLRTIAAMERNASQADAAAVAAKARADTDARNSVLGQAEQRSKIANALGLDGEERKEFIATGKVTRRGGVYVPLPNSQSVDGGNPVLVNNVTGEILKVEGAKVNPRPTTGGPTAAQSKKEKVNALWAGLNAALPGVNFKTPAGQQQALAWLANSGAEESAIGEVGASIRRGVSSPEGNFVNQLRSGGGNGVPPIVAKDDPLGLRSLIPPK